MAYHFHAAPAAPTTAFVAAQECLRSAENDASEWSSVLDPDADQIRAHAASLTRADDARAARDVAARPAYAAACLLVEGLLSHYPDFNLAVGPTVPAALENAMLSTSFYSLAQELEDAAAPSGMILDFRRQWRRFHELPEASHGHAKFPQAQAQSTFGAAAALFVDELHVSDVDLSVLVHVWRSNHEELVSERGTLVNPFSLTAQLTLSRRYVFNF